MEVRSIPKAGKRPARIIIAAPVAMANLFTTPLIEASPTFWLKLVIGVQPKRPAMELTKPSQAMDPESSLPVISLCRADEASAEVSPMVSVAETRKTTTMESIAPRLNTGLKGIMFGSEIMLASPMAERFTIPIQQARM